MGLCDSELAHSLRLLALGSARAEAQQAKSPPMHGLPRSKATGHNTSTDPSAVGPTGHCITSVGRRLKVLLLALVRAKYILPSLCGP